MACSFAVQLVPIEGLVIEDILTGAVDVDTLGVDVEVVMWSEKGGTGRPCVIDEVRTLLGVLLPVSRQRQLRDGC